MWAKGCFLKLLWGRGCVIIIVILYISVYINTGITFINVTIVIRNGRSRLSISYDYDVTDHYLFGSRSFLSFPWRVFKRRFIP